MAFHRKFPVLARVTLAFALAACRFASAAVTPAVSAGNRHVLSIPKGVE